MGTKIQSIGITAESYHTGQFKNWPVSLVGNNDILCLTTPDVIRHIHEEYIEAGADIITTNTFSANRISQKEYGCEEQAREMALAGARIARQAADNSLTSHLSPLTSHLSPLTSNYLRHGHPLPQPPLCQGDLPLDHPCVRRSSAAGAA